MQQLTKNVFVETGIRGCNHGFVTTSDGIVMIDSPHKPSDALKLKAEIARRGGNLRYIINTGPDADHVGGNEAVSKAGETLFTNTRLAGREFLGGGASILSAEAVLQRMSVAAGSRPAFAAGGWPTETFHYPRKYLFLNGEGIEVLHQPAAHTDGDSIVFFRRSDVVAAGDILDLTRFPLIDVPRGGSVQGEIDGLNKLVELAIPSVPLVSQDGGTYVVPGHGRLCDQLDVVEYRDMVTIIRDRVQDAIRKGMTLDQVLSANPTQGYTQRYGSDTGTWTTKMFVEAVYESLRRRP